MSSTKRILTVVGARPQFVKAAVVSSELRRRGAQSPYEEILLHTGQHYDPNMSAVFFQDLDMRDADINLQVGSNTPAKQTGAIMAGLEDVIKQHKPDAVLAYGDTNSTLAAAIVCSHLDLPFIHVEAGERTYRRWQMPEEINRIVADHAAGICLATTERAVRHLQREWHHPERVKFVGDTMYDLFLIGKKRLEQSNNQTLPQLGLTAGEYHLATIHRVENTASRDTLVSLLESLDRADRTVILPLHPRVKHLLDEWGWSPSGSLRFIEAQGYFDFLALLLGSHRVVTDSGGVTREAFFAGKPSVIPMRNNAWVEIVESGFALEVGEDREALSRALNSHEIPTPEVPQLFGDGEAARQIVDAVGEYLGWPDKDGPWHRYGWWRSMPEPQPGALDHAGYSALIRGLAAGSKLTLGINTSWQAALDLAKISDESATFLLNLGNPWLNPFSDEGIRTLLKIVGYGHRLAADDPSSPEAQALAQILETGIVAAPTDFDFTLASGIWAPALPTAGSAVHLFIPCDLVDAQIRSALEQRLFRQDQIRARLDHDLGPF